MPDDVLSDNLRQEQQYISVGGLQLFQQAWLPAQPRASLILAHGCGEHLQRYDAFARYLAAQGFAVYAHDHRGHGRSQGALALLHNFGDLVEDFACIVRDVRQRATAPLFLLGHSMGGAVVLEYLLRYPEEAQALQAVVLSAAFLQHAQPPPAWQQRGLQLLSRFFPTLPVEAVDSKVLARDPAVLRAYDDDPLVYHRRLSAALCRELLAVGPRILAQAARLQHPSLIVHGGADALADAQGSQALHAALGSRDKQLRIYPEAYHEILNDYGHESVWQDIANWLEQQYQAVSA